MKRLAGLVALLLLVGCGGSGGGGGGGTGTISDARRETVINEIKTRYAAVKAAGGDMHTQNLAMADFMATFPEIEETGSDDEFFSAWGRFADGRLLIIGNYPFFGNPPAPGSSSALPPPTGAFIAKPSKARLGHMFGANFAQLQDPINDMTRYLQVDGSYTVSSPPEGKLRLSDYKAVAGDGFVYFNSHAGEGKTKTGRSVFVMVSSTPHDAATDALPEIKADWDADLLTYYIGDAGTVNGVTTYGSWYAINHKFVKKYMSFGPKAIVFLNVCFTANAHLDVGTFRQAFFDSGAGAVLGWTKLCQAPKAFGAAKYFVDRLVAKNEFEPELREQRPFSILSIMRDMVKKNKTVDGASELKASFAPGVTDVGLRPSIQYMLRDELNDYLVLHGSFGDEAGVVTVNNVPATVLFGWSDKVLITRIPQTGLGSDGPVVVEVNGKKSNERYLTSWRGTYTYSFQDSQNNSTLHETMTAKIHIRMDIDDYRETAGGTVLETDPKAFYASSESTLTWSCGGQITDTSGVFMSWEGGGSPTYVRKSITGPTGEWTCLGGYDPVTRKLVFGIVNGGKKTVHHRGSADTYSMGPSGSYSKPLNPDFSGPPQDNSSGDTTAKMSALTVTWPPPNDLRSPRG